VKPSFYQVSERIMLIKVRGTAILNVYLPCDTRENEYLYAYEIARKNLNLIVLNITVFLLFQQHSF